ncbi:MAG: mannose-1-phosphate guanylyltransferase [Candidatus Cloacimonetes bacterium]|nr:sugar phosphate nucleotidyltransferase [Candidatus Cloacimonadota bacterium]MDD4156085.1 mannose-1-phosphate guanylyltransferase [Candidatus Cloacimonadota bacterium]
MIAVIMAGGSGTRFWPLSRENKPKQFLKLFNNKSMIRLTYERLLNFISPNDIYVVTTQKQASLILEHIPELSITQIINEPCGMNTAPCIALSIAYLEKLYNKDEIMYILPADHYIPDIETYQQTLLKAIEPVQDDSLLTFGIIPDYPATGYGYIEAGNKYSSDVFHVKQFKEKPDFDTALKFINSGNFFWNSGIFCWKLSTITRYFELLKPQIIETARKVFSDASHENQLSIYCTIEKTPIDIAIMEKADKVTVIPAKFKWSDVGNWYSLSNLFNKDQNNNYLQGNGITIESTGNSIFTNKFTGLVGVDDILVCETDDALLILNKNMAENVKTLTNLLNEKQLKELL